MRCFPRTLPGLLLQTLLAMMSLPVLAATTGDGLRLASDTDAWPRWQARLSIVTTPSSPDRLGNGSLQLGAARLSGDRYFDIGRVGDGGGLRATSALLLGSTAAAMSAPGGMAMISTATRSGLGPEIGGDLQALPYVGLGYSAWWVRSGLGLSADLGLVAQRPGQALRNVNGVSSLDNAVRAMQLSPVFQLNLSYAF